MTKFFTETKEKIADHENGRSLLEDEEYARLTKRIGLLEKKAEQMSREPDEREIEKMMRRMHDREERRREHMEL